MSKKPLEDIFEQRSDDLLRFIRYRVRDPDDARDLLQESFLRLLRHDRQALVERPEAYLFRIAANLAYEHRLRLRRQGTVVDDSPEATDAGTAPERRALNLERVRRVQTAFDRLPPLPRAALLLQRRDGLSYAEIAARLQTTTHMVKKHLSRAMAECRGALDDGE